jgi:hypothetical protein
MIPVLIALLAIGLAIVVTGVLVMRHIDAKHRNGRL